MSNRLLAQEDRGTSGTWLEAMARGLAQSGEVALANITTSDRKAPSRAGNGGISQWVVPRGRLGSDGLPGRQQISYIQRVVSDFQPDLIHVWGTEQYWGLLTARKLLGHYPALLEIQGLKGAISSVYEGGLSCSEQAACVGIKEIVKRSSIPQSKRAYRMWGEFEREMISGHRFVTVQSDWSRAHVETIHPRAEIQQNNRALREEFYQGREWSWMAAKTVLCITAYPAPFKGLHTAVRAISILKDTVPGIQLRLAGACRISGWRRDGYLAWVQRQARKLGVADLVTWLGPLGVDAMIDEMSAAGAMLLPSFIESYGNALLEAMTTGVPCVVSYAGGMPSLASHGESALFFPPGDEQMCAYLLRRVVTEPDLARQLSVRAQQAATIRNDRKSVVDRQLSIYRLVLVESGQREQTDARRLM